MCVYTIIFNYIIIFIDGLNMDQDFFLGYLMQFFYEIYIEYEITNYKILRFYIKFIISHVHI